MSTLVDKPLTARYENGKVHVKMDSGLEFAFPVQGNPRLEGKTPEQLNHIEVSPYGLHWPELDEDLSIKGILAGDYGQQRRRSPQPS